MDEILNMSISEMPGKTFKCSCGRMHSVGIHRIAIGGDLSDEIIDAASAFKSGGIFLIADNNTYGIHGRFVENMLQINGLRTKSHVFNTRHPLVPDEKALGRLLMEVEKDTTLIMAVGSGTLNDIARFMSFKLHIPYMVVCTAPSMDGYASTVSPLIVDGFKKTFEAVYPYAIIADTGVMKGAPVEMVRAGFGDIVGKMTALTDWQLARVKNNEYYCETSVRLVRSALQKCMENAGGIEKRDEAAVGYITEALIMSGVAMGLVGNSRPASGAEHHVAHFWEIDALAKGVEHPLHGNSVGAASVVIAYLYELLNDKLPAGVEAPKPEEIKKLLKESGSCDNPAELGISRDLFKRSVLHAMDIRPRYTVFHLAAELGLLERYAGVLTEKFYG